MLPALTRSWCDIVGLFAELATRQALDGAPDLLMRDAALAQLRQQAIATAQGADLAAVLASRFGLTQSEELAVWTLIAAQLDSSLGLRIQALGAGDDVVCGAIAAIAFSNAPAEAIRALSSDGTLSKFGLVELSDAPSTWARRKIMATERLISIGRSDASREPRSGRFFVAPRSTLASDKLAVGDLTIVEAREAIGAADGLVGVIGLPGSGRATTVASLAREAGLEILEIDARRLAKDKTKLERELRVCARECRLLAMQPLLTNIDALDDIDRLGAVSVELFENVSGIAFFTSAKTLPAAGWTRPVVNVEMRAPTAQQRGALWLRSLETGSESDARVLASQYPLAGAFVVRAATAARARAKASPIKPEHIAAGVRSVLDDRLGTFAKRVTVTQTWQDLVLSQDHVETITELISRVRERNRVYEEWGFGRKVGKGLGVAALFSGPPGTGKTMAASLIAQDLGLALYRVDLSKIVSKWIGESEKNLEALFDAAEAGHAVLLFDEADSLFGKRTDVKSSNDRYANLETNFLLQRLESFTGICLLTSNHESNIDPAFLRRLSLHLRFDVPDLAEREHLWRVLIPEDAPRAATLDFAGLARSYEISGGYIRNAALRAAFFAADEQTAISTEHLRRAARLECEAMGRIAA